MRRPALIFDFGNVVAHFDHARSMARLGAGLGESGEELLARLRTLGFGELLIAYESGRIPAEEFSAKVAALAGVSVTHDEFVAAWSDIFWPNESIAPLFGFLKGRGYVLVLGSNTNDVQADQFRRQFAETLGHFDRLVLSYEVGQMKPSAVFYLACAEAAGADPGDCLFIDDLIENVDGARAAGLVGVHYRSTPELLVDLSSLGVEIPPSA